MSKLLTLLIALAFIVLCPFAVLWGLNTLFALAIPYTLHTWGAVMAVLGGSAVVSPIAANLITDVRDMADNTVGKLGN